MISWHQLFFDYLSSFARLNVVVHEIAPQFEMFCDLYSERFSILLNQRATFQKLLIRFEYRIVKTRDILTRGSMLP